MSGVVFGFLSQPYTVRNTKGEKQNKTKPQTNQSSNNNKKTNEQTKKSPTQPSFTLAVQWTNTRNQLGVKRKSDNDLSVSDLWVLPGRNWDSYLGNANTAWPKSKHHSDQTERTPGRRGWEAKLLTTSTLVKNGLGDVSLRISEATVLIVLCSSFLSWGHRLSLPSRFIPC